MPESSGNIVIVNIKAPGPFEPLLKGAITDLPVGMPLILGFHVIMRHKI